MALKLSVVVVALVLILSGRPPASGQSRIVPENPTASVLATEDALQDRDINDLRTRLIADELTIKDQDKRIYTNADDISVLNTKWLCAMGVLVFLQSSGLLVQILKNKAQAA